MVPPQANDGHGPFRVSNGTAYDAVVLLVDGALGNTVRAVYIRAKHEIALNDITVGHYVVHFATGHDWNESRTEFDRDASFYTFVTPFRFTEHDTSDGTKFVGASLTLHRVPHGTAKTKAMSKAAFQRALLSGRQP